MYLCVVLAYSQYKQCMYYTWLLMQGTFHVHNVTVHIYNCGQLCIFDPTIVASCAYLTLQTETFTHTILQLWPALHI